MPKTQKDIGCDQNSDSNAVERSKTDKDAGKALDDALTEAKVQARKEQKVFKDLLCPKSPKKCTQKKDEKGDDDDITPAITGSTYNKATKEWTIKVTQTWTASFDCEEPSKKK